MLCWQFGATLVCAAVVGWRFGVAAGISALLGGSIGVAGTFLYGAIVSRAGITSAGNVLRIALRAEAAKIALMGVLLWWVLTGYRDVTPLALLSVFAATVLMFRFSLFIRDDKVTKVTAE